MRIAYYALHYGKEYLAHSIRSVQDAVDEIHILYSSKPSFGHATQAINPDTLPELMREAHRFQKKPIIWHEGDWKGEGQHRDTIIEIGKRLGASVIAPVDADELWDTDTLKACLDYVEKTPMAGVGRYRASFVHFWRSFNYFCRDACMPERVIDLRCWPGEINYLPSEVQTNPIYHFGYAQSEALMQYKWLIHGHQDDLRPKWVSRFLEWKYGDMDMHPTNEKFWNPEPIDEKLNGAVDKLLFDHPYRRLEIIR